MKKRGLVIILLALLIISSTSVTAFSFLDWFNFNLDVITGRGVGGDDGGQGSDPYGGGSPCGVNGFCQEDFIPGLLCQIADYEECPPEIGLPICCEEPFCGNEYCEQGEDQTNCCYDCPCILSSNEPICNSNYAPYYPSECRACQSDAECEALGINKPFCDLKEGSETYGKCMYELAYVVCSDGTFVGECSVSGGWYGYYCNENAELVMDCDTFNCGCKDPYVCFDIDSTCQLPGGGEGDFFECEDNQDNDNDGFIDYLGNDPDCEGPFDDSEGTIIPPEDPACSDGIDNDGDGLIDEDDPGCNPGGIYDPDYEKETIDCGITDELPLITDGDCYGGSKCLAGDLTPLCSECDCPSGYTCTEQEFCQETQEIIEEEIELSCYGADGYCETECASGFIDSNNIDLETNCFELWDQDLKCCIPQRQSGETLESTQSCLDEYKTSLGSCSQEKPFFCSSSGNLERDCITCGCPEGQVCNEEDGKECLTPIQEARKFARLSPESKIVIGGVVAILAIATILFIAQHHSQRNIKSHKKPKKRRKKKK